MLLFAALTALLLSYALNRRGRDTILYHNRWVWGVVFGGIVVFLAIQTTGLVEQRLNTPQESGFLLQKAQGMQLRMVEKLGILRLADTDKSILATLTVNYRYAMSCEIFNQFSVTGVAHLLSVSGFHVAIVCAFINFLLQYIPDKNAAVRWIKHVNLLICVWAFAYISGLATAAVRAAVMISIYFIGKGILGRKPDRYNTLACAAFCMLVYNPFYLFSVGFQLSFVAVFFILYLQPRLSRLIEIRNPLIANPWDVLTVTISAQIGTSFLSFYYFGHCSLVFIFTNLALSFLATLLVPLTLCWMNIPDGIPGIGLLQSIIETMTRWMMWIVERFASIPGATLSIRFDFFTLVLSYLFLAFLLIYFRSRRYRMLFASLVTLLIILCRQLI